MTPAKEERLEAWMRSTFGQASGVTPEVYPAFATLFRSIYASVLNGEKIDTLENPQAPLEDDDPDSPPASQCVEEQALEKLGFYLDRLAQGHSERFAMLYALEACSLSDARDTQRVFYKIYASQPQENLSSPAYAEAHRVCIHQGQSEFYAHQCAKALMNNDFNLPEAMTSAREYEEAFDACLRRGRSMLYARIYADELVFCGYVGWAAAAYAWSYESQIKLGKSPGEAEQYASIYRDYFDSHSTSEEMEEGSGYSEWTTVYAEAATRWVGKPFDKDGYITAFANCYYSLHKPADQPMIEYFSVVEAAADRKCAG